MNFKPALAGILICLLACHSLPAQKAATATTNRIDTLASLQESLAGLLSHPRFTAAMWGVKIVSLDSGKTLFEQNASKLLKPASNAKLYTGALALDRLGPDYRIKTSLYTTLPPDDSGTLAGDLVILGRGDPCFSARFNHGDYRKALEPIVQALNKAGVKRIRGGLVGDESFFHGPPLGSGWTWDDLQNYYGAEVSALTVQDNVVDLSFRAGASVGDPCLIVPAPSLNFLTLFNHTVTVGREGRLNLELYRPIGENIVRVEGTLPLASTNHTESIAVHQPAAWFLALLKEALSKEGIEVSGELRTLNWFGRHTNSVNYSNLLELASVESRPLSEILEKMMKPSQNLYAQLLLLQVGARDQSNRTNQTTEEAGLGEMNRFLAEAGVKKGEVLLEEGSGLSRSALVTPGATVALLQYMSRHRHARIYRDALPIAGLDGTLRTRMKGTAAAENVRAKTGSLRYVNSLSGYVTTAAGERLAFSLMLNNHAQPAGSARADLDAIAVMLANYKPRDR